LGLFRLLFGTSPAVIWEEEMQMAEATRNTPANPSNKIKDPDDCKTGDEPMTGAQESFLNTLASDAGEPVEGELTKAEASKKIDDLRDKTGRGN
jgi:hypothetical protein